MSVLRWSLPMLVALAPGVAAAQPKPEPAKPAAPKTAKPAKKAEPDTRILLIGDSMIATDYGRQLERRLDRHPRVDARRRGKSATGLARPDYFDWMGEAKRRLKQHDPDVVVVVIGGNDGQDLIDKAKKKRRVIWKTKKWAPGYTERLEAFVKLLAGTERTVVWLELPAMAKPRLEKKLKTIRAVQKTALAKFSDEVVYVPTRALFYDAKDKLRTAVKVRGYKKKQALRQEDGIHFTVPGAKYFADGTAKAVLKAAGID